MGTQAKIEAMTLNGRGVSDIVRVLGIGKNTVIRVLKNFHLRQLTQEKISESKPIFSVRLMNNGLLLVIKTSTLVMVCL